MRVQIQEEEKVDPWTLLDPHEKSAVENKPMRKGQSYYSMELIVHHRIIFIHGCTELIKCVCVILYMCMYMQV